ncbi:MAG TPA: hypothetical protein VGL51_05860 [Solirubrobacteraceae bacterium]|jgi:hypothetical protein
MSTLSPTMPQRKSRSTKGLVALALATLVAIAVAVVFLTTTGGSRTAATTQAGSAALQPAAALTQGRGTSVAGHQPGNGYGAVVRSPASAASVHATPRAYIRQDKSYRP